MMTCDIDRILVGVQTQIRLFTDHRNWVQSPASAQAPVFAAPSGLAIVSQEILDDHTALLTVNPTTANTLATLADTVNKEAVTLKCWGSAQFTAMIEVSNSDNIQSGKTEADNPIDDGYWDSSSIGGFAGSGLI